LSVYGVFQSLESPFLLVSVRRFSVPGKSI
jgi:hypothetical protein